MLKFKKNQFWVHRDAILSNIVGQYFSQSLLTSWNCPFMSGVWNIQKITRNQLYHIPFVSKQIIIYFSTKQGTKLQHFLLSLVSGLI